MRPAATIAVFCAGGGLTRYYLSGWLYSILGRGFSYGTFAVNTIDAYFIGLIMELGLGSTAILDTLRLGLTVGFMGGTDDLLHFQLRHLQTAGGRPVFSGFTNVLASVAVCLIFTWLGIITIRSLS
jgi:CrcB protein